MTAASRNWIVAISAAGTGAVGVILFHFDPEKTWFYPACQFHQFTGLDCPGCGSQRALHALLHGQVLTAAHDNLLLILSLPLFLGLAFWFGWRAYRGQKPAVLIHPAWAWVYVAAWILFGILRNLPFPPFASFAP
jgi:hypothetical protein